MGDILTVNFRGDDLYGFREDDGTFLALKPMVEAMGLNWQGQHERVNRDPVLSQGIRIMRIPFGRGGAQETLCIKLELVNGWLFGIDSGRIKDEAVRERVILYQRECYQVLHDHFTGKRANGTNLIRDGEPDELPSVNECRSLVTEARQTFGSLAARQLWFRLGLYRVDAMFALGANDRQGEFIYHPAMVRPVEEVA